MKSLAPYLASIVFGTLPAAVALQIAVVGLQAYQADAQPSQAMTVNLKN